MIPWVVGCIVWCLLGIPSYWVLKKSYVRKVGPMRRGERRAIILMSLVGGPALFIVNFIIDFFTSEEPI